MDYFSSPPRQGQQSINRQVGKSQIIVQGKIRDTTSGWTYGFSKVIGFVTNDCPLSDEEIKSLVKTNLTRYTVRFCADLYFYYSVINLANHGIIFKGIASVTPGSPVMVKFNLRKATGLKIHEVMSLTWGVVDLQFHLVAEDGINEI
ncbi:hypothetical protein [Hymenopteran arli-related virus OKIAV99]|uniref:Uncharacterized protein n=1 Tax=Hymenopteran arli-related virus OKIAV99 TaxID=2792566 RepID=A0AAE7P2G9_9MONO|nr:hypothetical protein QKT01_gp3 [Hymenopteran arli-related virus OKIAV99]QPL15343.1 hypothetical protein [Hymenopteran arli-related virus OKIAV99]